MNDTQTLIKLATLARALCIRMTTDAGSGHLTSCLSAADLMSVLLFGGFFRFDLDNPGHPNNDRLLFSKGHASALLYALYSIAGKVSEQELRTYRRFGSALEGHPRPVFPYAEAATGSLGQGLSVGVGMAISGKYLDCLGYRTFVLLGDSEMSEGSVWEAIQLAAHYGLDNLIGIVDVNRLGQRGETMPGHNLPVYEARVSSFGWRAIVTDGHSIEAIARAYHEALASSGKPVMILAKTVKGKGVPLLEDQDGWHGKALSAEEGARALAGLGEVETSARGTIVKPEDLTPEQVDSQTARITQYQKGTDVATRKAYGQALVDLFPAFPAMVVLDGEVGNSTYAELFKNAHPERFFEMFIAEQTMVSAALGLAMRGNIPFVSTFAAFFTRAFDQVRMSAYSGANITFVGSHGGVSIGEDGPSQMGLEDISLFRSVAGSTVLYPSDAVATQKLVEEAARHDGIVYIRTTRNATPILYDETEAFPVGGSKVLCQSGSDRATIIGAGITVHEALRAHELLQKRGVSVRVIDLYSIKPIDTRTLRLAAGQTQTLIVVEDHHPEGGIGEAVRMALADTNVRIVSLAVTKIPGSGKPQELLSFEGIAAENIVRAVLEWEKSYASGWTSNKNFS